MVRSRSVLVTGCSSGIGRATALRLVRAGWPVWATARRTDQLDDLAAAGCRVVALDVTDAPSMSAAVEAVVAADGAVGVLVNNAGYSQSGSGRRGAAGSGPAPVRDQRVRSEADAVAAVIEKAVTARRPRTRYRVTPSANVLLATRRLLPDRGWDGILRTQFPQPGRSAGS